MPPDEALIRKRAYEIWEKENRPHGRDREHWDEALRQIAAEDTATLPAPPAKRVRKPASAGPVSAASEPAKPAKRARKPASAGPVSAASEPAKPAKRARKTAGGDAPAPRRSRSKQPA